MSANEKIPFLDLVTLHGELEAELVAVFRAALRSCAFIGGPIVEEFEREFAAACGAEYCVGVGSGTDALRFALIGAGVKPGDTVITVPNRSEERRVGKECRFWWLAFVLNII